MLGTQLLRRNWARQMDWNQGFNQVKFETVHACSARQSRSSRVDIFPVLHARLRAKGIISLRRRPYYEQIDTLNYLAQSHSTDLPP